MKKSVKLTLGIGVPTLILGVSAAIFIPKLIKKNKAKKAELVLRSEDAEIDAEIDAAGDSYDVGYISERPTKKHNLVVHLKSPRPMSDAIVNGDYIELSGMDDYDGSYDVSSTWVDGNGDLGALYLIADTLIGESDKNYKYQRTGKITIV